MTPTAARGPSFPHSVPRVWPQVSLVTAAMPYAIALAVLATIFAIALWKIPALRR